jgi:hypothetical protein
MEGGAFKTAKGMVATVLCAGLILGTIPALASSKFVPTHLFNNSGQFETGGPKFYLSITGLVESSKGRCRGDRTLRLYFVRHQRRFRRDLGHSTQSGHWKLTGEARSTPNRFVVVAPRERVQHIVCGAAETGRKIR